MIMNDEMLLARVEAFLDRTKMPHTRLGVEALGDGGLVKGIREGRSLTLRKAEQLCQFMDSFESDRAASSSQAAA